MKYELFEVLRYLEAHAKNADDFAHRLHSLTPEEAIWLMSSMQKEEIPSKKND